MLLLPPAPALRVLVGLAFAIFSFWSAAARLRITVLGPPGGAGDEGRMLAPVPAPVGEEARGEDYNSTHVSFYHPQTYSIDDAMQ